MPMQEAKSEEKWLDLFYGLSAADQIQRQKSGMLILNQLCDLSKKDKEAFLRMAEYTLGRLIRAHSSSNLQTRGYMFAALSGILRVCKGIENEFVIGLIEKTLVVEKEDTKSNKLNKRVAAILTCGAVLHSHDVKEIAKETLADLIRRISQNAISKQIFMEYAAPFFIELFEKLHSQLKRKKKERLFKEIILPAMEPFIEKMKLPQNNFVHLRIALALHSANIAEDFEDFLRDQDTVVKTIMENDILDDKEMKQLFEFYSNSDPVSIDGFWKSITESLSSSHFNHLCALIEACSDHSITAVLNEKILNSLYYTIKSIRMREHKPKAVSTVTTIINWIGSSPYLLKCPEERITAIQSLFSGDQHILQQYKELSIPLKKLIMKLNESELAELTALCLKVLEGEKVSTRLCVTVVNFLSKIAQSIKLSSEARAEIVKRIVTVGKCRVIAETEENEGTNDADSEQQSKSEVDELDDVLVNSGITAFRSIISSTYNSDFIEKILNNPEIVEELKPKQQSHEYKEAMKKARKLLKMGKKDPHLYYVIGTYTLYLYLDAAAALPIIDELAELCSNRKNPEDEKETAEIIVKVVLSKILREQQPMINCQQLFNRLMSKNLLSDDLIKSIADAIDLSVDQSDDDDEDDSDSDGEDERNDENGEESEDNASDEEETDEDENEINTEVKIQPSANNNEDSDASMDLDDAPEEDLKRLDMILAHAAKKRSNDEGDKELQYTMRIKRLLSTVIKRKKATPLGEILKKKIRLV